MKYLKKIGKNSRIASGVISKISHKKIKSVLQDYNQLLLSNKIIILRENLKDIKNSKREHLIDRLRLNEERIEGIRNSISEIIKHDDPINKVLSSWNRPSGLEIKKVTTPIGVIGIIYESRPNVTADVAALCLKSRNCAILRGGSEAFNSNKILANLFREALSKNKIDKNCLQFIENTDRKAVDFLLSSMADYIDVIVPRGGKNLVKKVKKLSSVHVIGHLEGLCHIYLDYDSDLNTASKIIINSKMRRTSICGAVEIDWKTEYLDSRLSIKSVKDVGEAITHILKYGTMHTDGIITNNKKNAEKFLNGVNSAIAVHNASTQFADGGEFGFGGEIGISTSKLPPRGPVGIDQLTSYKYIVKGKGTIRS